MQRSQFVQIVIGIILIGIALFFVNVYLNTQKNMVVEQARRKLEQIQASQTAVLVARDDIPKGATITPDNMEIRIIPNQFVQPQAVTSLDRIAGMLTIAPISKGEQITLSKLAQTRQAGGLAEVTPVGKRAITISVDNLATLAGMLKPGDYVDVLAMIPVPIQTMDGRQQNEMTVVPIFQNILILAIGQEVGAVVRETGRYKTEQPKESSPLVTLALTPQQANLIAFVQEQGKIRLTLRSPVDAQIEPIQPASWEALFRYLMPPQETTSAPEPKKEAEPVTYVEIYRGLVKEKIPLSK